MTKYEIGMLVVGGLAGWWVISYLFDRKKTPGTGADESTGAGAPPPPADPGSEPRAGAPPIGAGAPAGGARYDARSAAASMSVLELQERWPALLGVDRSASVEEIETAYARRRVELDRVRFSDRPGADRDAVVRELRELEAAYEFVRAARSSAG